MKLFPSVSATVVLLSLSTPVLAADEGDNDVLCQSYGAFGGGVIEVLLPETLESMIKMMRGENPALLGKLTMAMTSNMDITTIGKVAQVDQAVLEILGEAAGEQVMQLALSGQVVSPAEAEAKMTQTCLSIGVDTIITHQRQVRAARAQLQQ